MDLKLPENWISVSFETIFENISISNLKIKEDQYLDAGLYPVIDQSSSRIVSGFTNDASKLVNHKGSKIVFGDHTKVIKLINDPFVPGADGIKVLNINSNLSIKYAYYLLKSLKIPNKGYARHFSLLKNFSYPLAPFIEQNKIVQKIEELFSEIDDGIQTLETAKKQLDVYRKAVLIQAFEGKLTEEWRALNSDKLPNEAFFLSAINHDREERYKKQIAAWNQELLDWEKSGKTGSKPKKPKPLPRIESTQLSTEGLPKGWVKTNLENVCDFITKGTTPAKDALFANQGDIPFIKVYNLTHKGYLDFSIDPTFVSNETHEGFLKRSKVYPNDVLMNIVGPPLGKVSIVPDTYPEWNINQAIAIYRSNLIDSKYLSEFLLNENTVRAMMSQSKATAGQFNLTLEICRNFPIPVCSKLEQAEIVKSLSENLTNAQYLQETIDQQLEQLTLLKQTVLQKAFSGELVPQDPNDEPASVLLERIKAEKEEEHAKEKAKKPPKKPSKPKAKTKKEDQPAQQELV